MILSDASIFDEIKKGTLQISPFDENQVQEASIDLRLGYDFMTWISGAGTPVIDPSGMNIDASINYERVLCNKNRPFFYLYPNQFALGVSLEKVKMPDDLLGKLDGRLSFGRIGLLINPNSRHIAPGFEGHIALELINVTNRPIKLTPEIGIAQLTFERLDQPSTKPYNSVKTPDVYESDDVYKPPVFAMLENLLQNPSKQ